MTKSKPYLQWTMHPDTHHWHYAKWMPGHFEDGGTGVEFNDGLILNASHYDLQTSDTEPGKDEIIDATRQQTL